MFFLAGLGGEGGIDIGEEFFSKWTKRVGD